MISFYKNCVIKVENEKTVLPKPLVFYEDDLFTIRFIIQNFDFHKELIPGSTDDVTDKTYADFFILQPDGNSVTVNNVLMTAGVVKFEVTTKVSKPEAVGHNIMQIRIGNINIDGDTSIITLPSFTFEIRPRVTKPEDIIVYNYLVDENGVAIADETGDYIVCLEK